MPDLTIAQIELIRDEVGRADLHFSHLSDDLLDHICCDVETRMECGVTFNDAFQSVKSDIGIGGLNRIQEDTLLLIHKKYRIMKKTMKVFGVVSPFLLSLAALFKIEHWPGASILLVLGFFTLAFVFLPAAVYVSYTEVSNRSKKLAHISGFLAGFVLSISFLFKIQHWPGANIATVVGMLITGGILIPSFFINKIRSTDIRSKKWIYLTGLVGSIVYFAGLFFKIQHWTGAAVFFLSGSVLLVVIAFPIYVIQKYRNEKFVLPEFIFIVVVVVWVVISSMLIRLNVSVNYLNEFFMASRQNTENIDQLSAACERLAEVLNRDRQADTVLRKTVDQVRDHSAGFSYYLGNLKLKVRDNALGGKISGLHGVTEPELSYISAMTTLVTFSEMQDSGQSPTSTLNEKIKIYHAFLKGVISNLPAGSSEVLKIIADGEKQMTAILLNMQTPSLYITLYNSLSDMQEIMLMEQMSVLNFLNTNVSNEQQGSMIGETLGRN